MFFKKDIKLTENTCARVFLFNQVAGLRSSRLKSLQTQKTLSTKNVCDFDHKTEKTFVNKESMKIKSAKNTFSAF